MARGVQQGQDAAVAVAEEVHGLRARGLQRLLDRVGQVAVGVVLEAVVRVALVGGQPVDQEDVEARGQQVLDERVARLQVQHVAARDERVDEQSGGDRLTSSLR
jgi:hypothetical protein